MATQVKTVCYGCKKPIAITKQKYNCNRKKNYHNYCSKECFSKYREKRIIFVQCAVCGKTLRRYKRSKSNTGKYYCNSCRGTVTVYCAICGEQMKRSKYDTRKYKILYCSEKCRAIGSRKDWNAISKGMLKYHWTMIFGEKSLVCKRCGYDKSYNVQLHHKKYIMNDGDNHPENLEPLCRNCHGEEHYKHGKDSDI